MLKTFTFVRMHAGWSREEFFQRWCAHTQEWDLRDHPEITLNRLMLINGHPDFVGIAENHWPDRASLEAAAAWYGTEAGRSHLEDLASFMDIENSPTVTVEAEALVDADDGVSLLLSPATVSEASR